MRPLTERLLQTQTFAPQQYLLTEHALYVSTFSPQENPPVPPLPRLYYNLYRNDRWSFRKLHVIHPESIFLLASPGWLMHSTDMGQSWEIALHERYSLLNDLIFFNEWYGWVAGNNGTLYRTRDGGETFEKIPLPSHIHVQKVFCPTENHVFLLAHDEQKACTCLFSNNAGDHWQIRSLQIGGLPITHPIDAAVIGPTSAFYLIEEGIFFTPTAGMSFQISLPIDTFFAHHQLRKIHFASPQIGIALSQSEHYRTTNGGQSWEKIYVPPAEYQALETFQEQWYISTPQGMIVSYDNAKTFTWQSCQSTLRKLLF